MRRELIDERIQDIEKKCKIELDIDFKVEESLREYLYHIYERDERDKCPLIDDLYEQLKRDISKYKKCNFASATYLAKRNSMEILINILET